jgi:DNA-binding protein HU-beta
MTEPFALPGLKNQAEIAILPYVLYNYVIPAKNTIRGENTMNKTELIAVMAETSGLSKKDCDAALAAFITTVETALKSGEKVQLIGFGSFEVKERAARTGRNPRTKETVEIPASKAPVFKAGQAFKDAIR